MNFIKDKIINLINKETILYIIFGVFTTIVDATVFYIFNDIIGVKYILSTIVAWVVAVLFAYMTNKFFVFNSRNISIAQIIKEGIYFFAARLLSLGFTILWMILMVEILSVDEFISKLVVNVFVVIINYFFSKLVIFKNKNVKKNSIL